MNAVWTVIAATGIALVQLWIKGVSRVPEIRLGHLQWKEIIKSEDLLFWIEWIVAAGFAVAFFVVRAGIERKPVDPSVYLFSFLLAILGMGPLPAAIGAMFQLQSVRNRTLGKVVAIVVADSLGLAVLFVSVWIGASIYG